MSTSLFFIVGARKKVYDKKAMVEKRRIMKAKRFGKVKKMMEKMKDAGELPSLLDKYQNVRPPPATSLPVPLTSTLA